MIISNKEKWLDKQKQSVSESEYDLIKCSVKVLTDNTIDDKNLPWSPYRSILPVKGRFDGIWRVTI